MLADGIDMLMTLNLPEIFQASRMHWLLPLSWCKL